jgi:cobalt-precorrin-5B (C1)-methyltransferase
MKLLADLATELGASSELRDQILAANTARHVLELAAAAGLTGITSLVCKRVAEHTTRHAGGTLAIHVRLVDFNGALLGMYPSEPAA